MYVCSLRTSNQSTAETADRYTDVSELLQDTDNAELSQSNSSATSFTEAVLQQENEMIQRIRHERQIAQQLVYRENSVQKVEVPEDYSVISMLTDTSSIDESNSGESASLSSVISTSTNEDPQQPKNKAKIKFNYDILRKIIPPKMTYAEALKTAEAYFSHKVNRETVNKDRILYSFLAERFPTEINQPTTTSTNGELSSETEQVEPNLEGETEEKEIDFDQEISILEQELQHQTSLQEPLVQDLSLTSEPHDKRNNSNEKVQLGAASSPDAGKDP